MGQVLQNGAIITKYDTIIISSHNAEVNGGSPG